MSLHTALMRNAVVHGRSTTSTLAKSSVESDARSNPFSLSSASSSSRVVRSGTFFVDEYAVSNRAVLDQGDGSEGATADPPPLEEPLIAD